MATLFQKECGKPVDKYIETEVSILLIDALLLRKEALRHILVNSHFQAAWKLLALYVLCDGYKIWVTNREISWSYNFKEEATTNLELEWGFYCMCIKAFVEYLILIISATSMLYILELQKKRYTVIQLLQGIIISSYGKLFTVPAFLWGVKNTNSDAFVTVFVFCSQVQACRVLTQASRITIITVLLIGWVIQLIVSNILYDFWNRIF